MIDAPPEQKTLEMYAQRLVDELEFLSALDSDVSHPLQEEVPERLRKLLQHFPEFLLKYHYEFCNALLPHCIQMRNLVSCAIPRDMHVPDPLTPGLKVDMLPEIRQPPHISTCYVKVIETTPFKQDLDSFLNSLSPLTVFPKVLDSIWSDDPNCPFDVPLINAIVLYVGTQAIDYINSKDLTLCVHTISDSNHSKFFLNLHYGLDRMGRYLLLSAICNQLTYPNSHTHYFSCLLQYLFSNVFGEVVHQQIASVVLERLAVKPYPWGLMITTAELMKNPLFELFTREYISSSVEIENALKPMAQEYKFFKATPDMYKVVPEEPKLNPVTDNPTTAEKQPE